jgi:hypothetical protein
MNSFLASGGDNFTVFRDGTDPAGGPGLDLDALEAYRQVEPADAAGAGPDPRPDSEALDILPSAAAARRSC